MRTSPPVPPGSPESDLFLERNASLRLFTQYYKQSSRRAFRCGFRQNGANKGRVLGNSHVPPSTKDSATEAEEGFDHIGCDVHKPENKGGAIVLGALDSRVGKFDHDGQVVGRYGEEIVHDNGRRMVAFLESNMFIHGGGR